MAAVDGADSDGGYAPRVAGRPADSRRAGLVHAANLAREYDAGGEGLAPEAAGTMVSFAEMLEKLAEERSAPLSVGTQRRRSAGMPESPVPDRAKLLAWPTRDLAFWCPGCGSAHWVPTAGERAWAWNGSLELPTLRPSLLRHGTHPELRHVTVCHLYLTDGRIQFLGDSSHALAGLTVDAMPVAEWPVAEDYFDG